MTTAIALMFVSGFILFAIAIALMGRSQPTHGRETRTVQCGGNRSQQRDKNVYQGRS
jgi:hypothetical protein